MRRSTIVMAEGQKFRARYGAAFGNQAVVIDKTLPEGTAPVRGDFKFLETFMRDMEGVREERQLGTDGVGEAVSAHPGARPDTEQPGNLGVADERPAQPVGGPAGVGDGASSATGSVEGDVRAGDREGGVRGARDTEQKPEQDAGGPAGTLGGGDDLRGVDRKASRVTTTTEKAKQEENATFSTYVPGVKLKGSKSHPAKLAESTAMASVKSPCVKRAPKIPKEIVSDGHLSDAHFGASANSVGRWGTCKVACFGRRPTGIPEVFRIKIDAKMRPPPRSDLNAHFQDGALCGDDINEGRRACLPPSS